jgi:hypothetical protein
MAPARSPQCPVPSRGQRGTNLQPSCVLWPINAEWSLTGRLRRRLPAPGCTIARLLLHTDTAAGVEQGIFPNSVRSRSSTPFTRMANVSTGTRLNCGSSSSAWPSSPFFLATSSGKNSRGGRRSGTRQRLNRTQHPDRQSLIAGNRIADFQSALTILTIHPGPIAAVHPPTPCRL